MPNKTDDKSRLSGARFVSPDTGSRRSQNDPYGFVGTTLAGRYQIEDLLGIGGMAVVYRAKHLATTRTVAIKILKPDLAYTAPQMVEEFLDEAKATANLNHRNIIEVSDADRDETGTTFLVMQYLKGKPLDDVIDSEQPLPFERIANLFEQICDGVQHAHANGIIHRDLKPGNIMVMADGRGEEMVKILDFGIAKAMTATAKVSREIGTIYYASPEQLSKGASIDPRSDIYSLGVILFQMLTGAVPFDDDSVEHIIYQKLNFAPPLMRQIRAEIPAPVEEVIQRALTRDPVNRYQDATEMARAFWRAISLETGALVIDCVDATGHTSLAGASVLINSKYSGQTDVKGHWRQSGMLPRQYLVELESPRFQHWRASVRVEPREEVTVTAEMQPEPKGDLVVACGVAGAQLELDQRKVGTTDESGRLYVEAVDAGKHHVRISHPKYISVEAEIDVGISEQAFLQLDLKPKNVIWWQRPVIVAPAVIALAFGVFLVYKAISWLGQPGAKELAVVIPSPTPTPSVEPTPEPSLTPTLEASPSAPQTGLLPPLTPKTGSTPFPSPTAIKATPTPTSTPPPTPPPTPDNTPSVANGLRALQQRDYSTALDMLGRFPRDPRALKGMADAYIARNQPANAAQKLEELLAIDPNNLPAISRLGDIYSGLGKHEQAVEKYKIVVNNNPDDPSANLKLCRAHYNRGAKGDYDEAVKRCGHAIVNSPNNGDAYALIDVAYQRLAKDGNRHAETFYKGKWTPGNRNPLPIYYQGMVYVRMKKKKEALAHVKILEEIGSSFAANLSAAAAVLR